MNIDFLLNVFLANKNKEAIIWQDKIFQYEWLYDRIKFWLKRLEENTVKSGEVIVLEADFSPNSIALFLALIETNGIIIPLTTSVRNKKDEFLEIAQAEKIITINDEDVVKIEDLTYTANHELYIELKKRNHPGLVLFSSGSTGKSKAAVHDFINLLSKYKTKRYNLRTLSFLMFDHIGGVDTMLYSLSNGSCIITIKHRLPDSICNAIEQFKVEVLPITPTFLNLIILSEDYKRYNLNSLKYITYGTEVMPDITIKRITKLFPNVKILQKYGTTEIGTLRSKSKSSNSLWVKVGGEGFETRIIDGLLEVKAQSAMLGYLNSPSPFTDDGWFKTGDQVETDGEYIKILGRKSEIINVGGEKVYPSEVESVIQEINNVAEVTVFAEKNIIMGNIVCAKVRLIKEEDKKVFTTRLKLYCKQKLQAYKIPVKIFINDEKQFSERFKKKRI